MATNVEAMARIPKGMGYSVCCRYVSLRIKKKEIMDKRVLKKIAKEWAAGILAHGTGMDSFGPELGLTYEEEGYIVEEVHRLGKSLLKSINIEEPSANLNEIVGKYYEFE